LNLGFSHGKFCDNRLTRASAASAIRTESDASAHRPGTTL
jgi:hypothetical protein